MSIISILDIARTALSTQQYGIEVTGHNIANVNTPEYSRQRPVIVAEDPLKRGGLLLGRGADVSSVIRATDQLVENRLMLEKSSMLSSQEMENYMRIFEGLFNENSDTGISSLLSDFWNSWHDISNDPSGVPQRIALYEQAGLLSEQLNILSQDLTQIETDLTGAVKTGIESINQLTGEIANLNRQIITVESDGNTANDLRDKRNARISELYGYLDVQTFEQDNGAFTVTTSRGGILVNGTESYDLSLGGTNGSRVLWENSSGTSVDITNYLTNGKLGGWLEMRDGIVAKYKLDLDAVAQEFIWSVNEQHSQGVGLKFFDAAVTGTYKTDSSGLLDTLTYGNKIDYTKDFKMWTYDSGATLPVPVDVDMGISTATVSNWAGNASAAAQYKYVFTVTADGTVETKVIEANGVDLGVAKTGADVSTALDTAIAAQTIAVSGGGYGTQNIDIANSGGDATKSAKDIARALNALNGVTAYASKTSAAVVLTDLADTEDGDEVSFILDVERITSTQTFTVDSNVGTLQAQFETAIAAAVAAINSANSDTDLTANGLTVTSASGGNIGIQNFDVGDKSTVTMDSFANFSAFAEVTVATNDFANFDNAGSDDLIINIQGLAFTIDLQPGEANSALTLATAFVGDIQAGANYAAADITVADNADGTFTITSNDETVTDIVLTGGTGDTGGNATLALSAGNAKTASTLGDNTFSFTAAGTDTATWSVTNQVTFDIGDGTSTDNITVDLTGIDTTSGTAMASAFNTALSGAATVGVVGFNDGVDTELTLLQTRADTDLTFNNTGGDLGTDATMALTAAAGTTNSTGDGILTWVGANSEVFQSAVETDAITFEGAAVTETGGVGSDSSVVAGTITIFLDPGLSIQSNVKGTVANDGGLFNVAADTDVTLGSSIVTLGGQGGFANFDVGDTVSFDVDGTAVTYNVALGDDTDLEFAVKLETALGAALGADYSISRNGASVSIIKISEPAIEITNFADDNGSGSGNAATLAVSAGTGNGTTPPDNVLLNAGTAATSTTAPSFPKGVISWEKYDATGLMTGTTGIINTSAPDTSDPDTFVVDGTLEFEIGAGTLVAGNTFTINTQTDGSPDKLVLTPASGTKANEILDTYTFKVTTGGTIGTDAPVIAWSNSVTSGTITITGAGNQTVDGMTLNFASGTLFAGDTFTVTTDASGNPTANLPTDWHWTLDSFKDQFNRQSSRVVASMTSDNALQFTPYTTGTQRELTNLTYNGGVTAANTTVTVDNYDRLTKDTAVGTPFRLTWDSTGSSWSISGNPGYTAAFLAGSDADTVLVDLNGDESADITISFAAPLTADGYVEFNIAAASGSYSFAFSDDEAQDSGLMAALGINTFFQGSSAGSIGINTVLSNKDNIAAAQIDAGTGDRAAGDNRNALALAGLQYTNTAIAQVTVDRINGNSVGSVTATIEGYYHATVGSIGVTSSSIVRAKEFNEIMVNNLNAVRDSISAVSLDEEMANLIKFQHAYAAAAKIINVADEMYVTLLQVK